MQNNKGYLFSAKYKRSMKSLLAMLLMVSMIFSWLPQADASIDAVIHIGEVSGKKGDSIEVPISYDSKGTNFSFYQSELSFTYDPAVLELVNEDEVVNNQAYAKYQGVSLTKNTSTSGVIRITMTTQRHIDEPGALYSLHFKIKENTTVVGESSVNLGESTWFQDGDPLPVTGENGKVTVKADEKPVGKAVVYIGSVKGKAGEKVTQSVDTVSLDQPIGSYGVHLKFNPAVLRVTNVTGNRSGVQYNVNNETGSLIVGWSDADGGLNPIPASEIPQTLFKIEFTIASGAVAGEYPVQTIDATVPEHFTVTDVDAIEMNKQFVPGSITVLSAPVTPTTPTTPSNPGSSNSGTSSSGSATPTTIPSASTSEKITVNVTNERNVGAIVSATTIERTTGTDGRKKDEVNLTAEQTSKAIQSLKQAASNIARILIPDVKDEVSELNVKLPAESTSLMANEKMNLYIETVNASLQLPASSLQGLGSDVFFHLVPIKDATEREMVKQRIQNDPLLAHSSANTADFRLAGRPMTIETNMSNRPVTVVLPITEPNLTPKELDKLQVFIEHSDGTKELVKGKIVKFNGTDQSGIEFEVTKFSTFSIVHINDSKGASYIQGYADGMFRPNQTVQRAEMAALISRALLSEISGQIPAITYKDVPAASWARDAITKVSHAGLMNGNANGIFMPGRSITRAEMAVIIDRVLKKQESPATAMTDATQTDGAIDASDITQHWAKEAVQHVVASGIMTVSGQGKFRPEDAVTRAEAVTMLNRLLNIKSDGDNSPMWKDVPVSHWAYGAIQAASQN